MQTNGRTTYRCFRCFLQVPDRGTMIKELEARKRHNTGTSVAFGSAKVTERNDV